MLRHTLATLAYRGGKALRGAPPEFASYQCAPGSRTPGEILAHLVDLMEWAVTLVDGNVRWVSSPVLDWEAGTAQFFASLAKLDARLEAGAAACTPEQLFQGPIADALTHVGQLAMLRRMAGCPIRGENYFKAAIAAGTVGPQQPAPRQEFD